MFLSSTILLRILAIGLGVLVASRGLAAAALAFAEFAAESWFIELEGGATIYGDQLFSAAFCVTSIPGGLAAVLAGASLMRRAGER